MPASTPIARSKSAALVRVLDAVPKGYSRWTSGTVAAAKAERLARKFNDLYGIGCTPAQRITRRKHKQANTLLAMYWPEGAEQVEWVLLATEGTGMETEKMNNVTDSKHRLVWLGYELVRHAAKKKTVEEKEKEKGKKKAAEAKAIWTWRRPKSEMAEHYTLLAELSNKRHAGAISDMLKRLANQPGFHGVRTQSMELFKEAKRRGYEGEVPFLFFMSRINHGDRLKL